MSPTGIRDTRALMFGGDAPFLEIAERALATGDRASAPDVSRPIPSQPLEVIVKTSPPQLMEVVKRHVIAACAELFSAHGCDISSIAEVDAEKPNLRGEWVMSVMGFGGETMQGTVCLVASRAIAKALLPAGIDLTDVAIDEKTLLRDAVGEFSNMLAGRLKNQLLQRGIVLVLAVPATSVASDIGLPTERRAAVWLRARTIPDPVYVQIEAVVDEGFRLQSVAPACAALPEGEMVTF